MKIGKWSIIAASLLNTVWGLKLNLSNDPNLQKHLDSRSLKRDAPEDFLVSLEVETAYGLLASFEIGTDPSSKKFFLDTVNGDTIVIGGDAFAADGHDNFECHVDVEFTESYIYNDTITETEGDRTITLEVITSNSEVMTLETESYSDKPYYWDYCTSNGFFDPKNSSDTFVKLDSAPFEIQEASGMYSRGFYGQDAFRSYSVEGHPGETVIHNFTFAVLNDSYESISTLGLGFPELECTNFNFTSGEFKKGGHIYENFPTILKSQGIVDKVMYSIFFNSNKNEADGQLIFGSVDTAKYEGELKTVDLVNTFKSEGFEKPVRFDVVAEVVTLKGSDDEVLYETNGSTVLMVPTLYMTRLPRVMFYKISEVLNLEVGQYGFWYTDCSNLRDDVKLELDLGNYKLSIPMSHFKYYENDSGSECPTRIRPLESADDYTIYLGKSGFQDTYTVFDFEDHQIALAKASFSKDDNVVDIYQDSDYSSLKKNSDHSSNTSSEDDQISSNSETSSELASSASYSPLLAFLVSMFMVL